MFLTLETVSAKVLRQGKESGALGRQGPAQTGPCRSR